MKVRAIYPVCCHGFQEEEVSQEPFVALTSEEEDEVDRTFSANQYDLMIWLYVRRESVIYIIAY